MALATRLASATQSNGVIYKGGMGRTVTVRANGSDIFLCAGVTAYAETDPDVDLAGDGEPATGVIVGGAFPYEVDLSHDSDNCFSDNEYLQMYIPEDGDQLYGISKTATTLTKDSWVKFNGGFLDSATKATAIGRAKQAITGLSGTEYVTLYEWGVN